MSLQNRPLSPHLQVYKPQITSVLSIMHRITGIGLAVGAIMLVFWLLAVGSGEEYYIFARAIVDHWLSQLFLLGWIWALFYHFCNGIRHIAWDLGYGLEMKQVRKSGWLIIILPLLLTAVCIFSGYGMVEKI